MRGAGGVLTAEDLASYATRAHAGRDRLSRPARAVDAAAVIGRHRADRDAGHSCGALPGGRDPRASAGQRGASRARRGVQARFADRARYLGDTDFVPVDVAHLTAPAYHAELARRIKPGAVLPRDAYGTLGPPPAPRKDGGTTHLSVIDAEGNAVALTTTVNLGFGAHLVAGKTGIVLNDEMDDFSLQPGVPNAFGLIGNEQNAIAPRKRPLSSMTPTLALDDGGRVRVVRRRRGRPDDHHGDRAGAPERRRLEDGRAGGDRGAAHPPPVVPRGAGRRAGDRRAPRSPASASAATR